MSLRNSVYDLFMQTYFTFSLRLIHAVYFMYYLQHERLCCISIHKLEARVVFLRQQGHECCKWLVKLSNFIDLYAKYILYKAKKIKVKLYENQQNSVSGYTDSFTLMISFVFFHELLMSFTKSVYDSCACRVFYI